MKKMFALSVMVFVFVLSEAIAAENDKKKSEAVSIMDQIVVTASKVKEKKKEITANMTVIDEKDIRLSSAKDIGDLLAEKGIGFVKKYPGNLTTIGIRGFKAETHGLDLAGHIIVLLDGHRIATANISKVMTKNVERVEIIRGPASVQYGSAAMGGVINIITKKGKGKSTAFVEGVLGDYNYKEWSLGASGKNDKFDFSASFTRSSMDDYDTGDGEKFYNSGYDSKKDCSLNIGYNFLSGDRISFIYTNYDADHVGNPYYISANDLDNYKDTTNRSYDFIYDGRTNNGAFSWQVRYYDGKDENEHFDPVASNTGGWDDGISSKKTIDHKGAQAQISYSHENVVATAGFDWMNYETKSDTYSPKNTEYDNPAGYILAKTMFFDQSLIITSGLRYDDYEVNMKDEGKKESDDNICPRIGAAYLLTDHLKIRANYGEAFRMPSADQLAADYISWYHYVGNPDLDPETSKTYEGGVDLFYESFNSSFTYFYTDFNDKIESYTTPAGDKSWKNIGKASISGIESEFSFDIGSFFDLNCQIKPYVNLVYLTKYIDKKTRKNLMYTPAFHITHGISVLDLKGFSTNLAIIHTSKQDITDYEYSSYDKIKKDGFTVTNLTISKKIFDYNENGKVTLKGEIQNVFDRDYEYVQGYPMPGRVFFINLRCDF